MRRKTFDATITGRSYVEMTGFLRVATNFRLRLYDDGDVVITTRGKLGNVPLSQLNRALRTCPLQPEAQPGEKPVFRRVVFRSHISGSDLLSKIGPIRRADHFRIQVYDNGDVFITTHGPLTDDDARQRAAYYGGDERLVGQYSVQATLERLASLESEYRTRKSRKRPRPRSFTSNSRILRLRKNSRERSRTCRFLL
jgi:hypothetical protein